MSAFTSAQIDECLAVKRFAIKWFGRGDERYTDDIPGGDGKTRYGACIVQYPAEPGVWHVGYYKDGPHLHSNKRRRRIVFIAPKVSELEAQAQLFFQ